MLFSSTVFLFVFLPGVLFAYYVLARTPRLKNDLLLVASLFFYAWGEPVHILVMILSIVGNYFFGLGISLCKRRKCCLIAAVCFNLGILFYFKYYNFTIQNLNAIFNLQIVAKPVTLPIYNGPHVKTTYDKKIVNMLSVG